MFLSTGFLQLNLQFWPYRGKAKYTLLLIFLLWLIVLVFGVAKGWRYIVGFMVFLSCAVSILGHYFMRRAGLDPLSAESGPTGSPQETRDLASFRDIPMIYDAHSKIPAGSIAYRMILSLGFDPILILVLVLLIFPAFFWALGFSQAMTKKTFFVFNRSGAEYMALRIFDEQLVRLHWIGSNASTREIFSSLKLMMLVD